MSFMQRLTWGMQKERLIKSYRRCIGAKNVNNKDSGHD